MIILEDIIKKYTLHACINELSALLLSDDLLLLHNFLVDQVFQVAIRRSEACQGSRKVRVAQDSPHRQPCTPPTEIRLRAQVERYEFLHTLRKQIMGNILLQCTRWLPLIASRSLQCKVSWMASLLVALNCSEYFTLITSASALAPLKCLLTERSGAGAAPPVDMSRDFNLVRLDAEKLSTRTDYAFYPLSCSYKTEGTAAK